VNCEGKDAVQSVEHCQAGALVEVQQHFRIRLAGEAMSGRRELCAQLAVVVDLAVECQRQPAVHTAAGVGLYAHGLTPGRRQVDDGQAPVAEPRR